MCGHLDFLLGTEVRVGIKVRLSKVMVSVTEVKFNVTEAKVRVTEVRVTKNE